MFDVHAPVSCHLTGDVTGERPRNFETLTAPSSCGRLVLGQGAKILSGSTQGIYPRQLRKLNVSGSRNSKEIREMMRKEMK